MPLSVSIFLLLSVFVIGYLLIIFEFVVKVNKTAVALFTSVICWLIFFLNGINTIDQNLKILLDKLSEISQIIFFLIGAMTLVQLIDSHKGFNSFLSFIHTNSKRKMLWLISLFAFFLSAVLDNLTTTILMILILRKLIPKKKERFLFSCMIIVAANAGGAWTPIGDVTTTMLWISGQISTLKVIKELFIPSLIALIIPLSIYSFFIKGNFSEEEYSYKEEKLEPGANFIFILGVIALLFVPIFKWLTGLPPFMGMLISLATLWIITDIMHYKYEQRVHLRIPFILTKIDITSVLFFLGILLTIDSLQVIGILKTIATWLNDHLSNQASIATLIGLFSAIIDNVPLVAATIGMYDLHNYPMDSNLWLMIAYAAGTGGSILILGSSAGVALMGMEKISFFGYLKKMSLPVLLGYILGMLAYVFFLQN